LTNAKKYLMQSIDHASFFATPKPTRIDFLSIDGEGGAFLGENGRWRGKTETTKRSEGA
jgi:hypothetical protein